MSILDALLIAVYVGGFVVTYREAYVRFDSDMPPHDPGDRAFNALPAMCAGLFWPIVIVAYGIYRGLTPVTPRERKEMLDARERHIRQLERELGIGDGQ